MASQFPTCLKHHKLVVCKWPNDLHREMCETFSQMAKTCVQVSLKSSSHTFIHMQQTANVNKTQTKSAELSKVRVQVAGQAPRRNTGEKRRRCISQPLDALTKCTATSWQVSFGWFAKTGWSCGSGVSTHESNFDVSVAILASEKSLETPADLQLSSRTEIRRVSRIRTVAHDKNDETHCWGYFFHRTTWKSETKALPQISASARKLPMRPFPLKCTLCTCCAHGASPVS